MKTNQIQNKVGKIPLLIFITIIIAIATSASLSTNESTAKELMTTEETIVGVIPSSRNSLFDMYQEKLLNIVVRPVQDLFIEESILPIFNLVNITGLFQASIMEVPPPFKYPWYDDPWYYTGGPHGGGSTNSCTPINVSLLAGVDFDKADRLEVLAMADGIIVQAGWNYAKPWFGYTVTIDHSINCSLCGYQTLYAHLGANPTINPGIVELSPVSQGTVIGLVGNSGTDPDMPGHLHVELLYGTQPVSWDGILIDGWTIQSITKTSDPAIGLNYEGTATMGSEAPQSLSLCGTAATIINGSEGTKRADVNPSENNELNSTNAPLCGGGFMVQNIPAGTHNVCTKPNLGVTPPGYDDIGEVLSRPEINYPWSEIPLDNLVYFPYLEQYDIVFINCTSDIQNSPSVSIALQEYVRGGGSIYASDWAYKYIQDAFPGFISFYGEDPHIGNAGTVIADIIDPGLAKYLNPDYPSTTIDLNYNLGSWVVIDHVSSNTIVHLRGDIQTSSGQLNDKPLTVSFNPYPDSPGKVIYTTFHNEAQQSDLEKKLLEYLVLIPATSELVKEAEELLDSYGAYAYETNINTIDPGVISPLNNFNPGDESTIIFGANWAGGTMRLSVYYPNGSLFDQLESNTPPIAIVVTNPQAGNWKYQMTAVNIAYENYPYVVTIGLSYKNAFLPLVTHISSNGFNSQFNGSLGGWEALSGGWTVDDNYYSTLGMPGYWSSSSYLGNFSDFTYKTSLKRSGCLQCSYGVLIRGNPDPFGGEYRWNTGYGFYINHNRQYSIFVYYGGYPYLLQDWTYSELINQGDNWNMLQVNADGANLEFLINGNLVWSGFETSYSSGRVGIAMYRTVDSGGDKLQVDWATLELMGVMMGSDIGINVNQQTLINQNIGQKIGEDRVSP